MDKNRHYSPDIRPPENVPGPNLSDLKEETANKPEAYIENYESGAIVDCEQDSLDRWHETKYLDRLGWSACVPQDSDTRAFDLARILTSK